MPAPAAARQLGRPCRIAPGPAAHRACIVTRPAAPAGTPTSGHGACPRPAPGLRERESSWSGENAFPPLLAPGERGSFFIQGFADRAFQLPLEQRLLCHRVGDKGRPKKKKKKQIDWKAGLCSNSGKWGVWDSVPVFVWSNCFFFFLLLWEAALAAWVSPQAWVAPCKSKSHSLPEHF